MQEGLSRGAVPRGGDEFRRGQRARLSALLTFAALTEAERESGATVQMVFDQAHRGEKEGAPPRTVANQLARDLFRKLAVSPRSELVAGFATCRPNDVVTSAARDRRPQLAQGARQMGRPPGRRRQPESVGDFLVRLAELCEGGHARLSSRQDRAGSQARLIPGAR